ncbi:MAG: RluA family pseudouridine synthase [Bythopirellula sp.]
MSRLNGLSLSTADPQLDVVFDDTHLLVVHKRAELPTLGVAEDRPSLLNEAKEYIRRKYHKPGNVYLGVVSRLDAPVTGLVVIARTSKAASRLSAAFRDRQVTKIYLAAVSGVPDPAECTLEHYLRKDERHRRVHTTHQDCPDAQLARLSYRVLSQDDVYSLVEVELDTGRKHQIRVQLAKVGHPIIGDIKYGSTEKFPAGIALHASKLRLKHPVRDDWMSFTAPPPPSWMKRKTVKTLLSTAEM